MQKETQLHVLLARVEQATLATFLKRPLPVNAHQAAAELYNAVDAYAVAINHNHPAAAKLAASKLAVEALRVMLGYELPEMPRGVEKVKVEAGVSHEASNIHAAEIVKNVLGHQKPKPAMKKQKA